MKKTKKIAALFIAASMTLSAALSVSALDIKKEKYIVQGALGVSGEIPKTGISAIDGDILKAADNFRATYNILISQSAVPNNVTFTSKLENAEGSERYAQLDVTIGLIYDPAGKKNSVSLTYYIDTKDNKSLSKSDYDAGIKAEKEEKEAKDADSEAGGEEPAPAYSDEQLAALVPLRSNAEALGFKVGWNAENKSIVLTKDDVSVEIAIDDVYALVGDEDLYELAVAPKLVDGVTQVPVELFVKCLGAHAIFMADSSDINFELDPDFVFASNVTDEA